MALVNDCVLVNNKTFPCHVCHSTVCVYLIVVMCFGHLFFIVVLEV